MQKQILDRNGKTETITTSTNEWTKQMSKKDYIILTETIAKQLNGYLLVATDGPTESRDIASRYTLATAALARALAERLKKENKRFNESLFLINCGLTSDGAVIL